MNKKFLSAILFGALMVTSTGTFVSCKDYDDDIENLQGQISANTTAIAELKALIGDGNYVTSVTVSGQNLVVNTKNGSTTVALPECEDEVGSFCEVVDGVLYIDGKATDIKVCAPAEENEFKPAVSIVDGEWAVLQEDGSYLSTGVAVSSVAVTGDKQNGYVLTVKDAEGNATIVELPTAASAVSGIELLGYTTGRGTKANGFYSVSENSVLMNDYTIASDNLMKDWKGNKAKLKKDDVTVAYTMNGLTAFVSAPSNVDAKELSLSLVNTKGGAAPVEVVLSDFRKDVALTRAASVNSMYNVKFNCVVFNTANRTIAGTYGTNSPVLFSLKAANGMMSAPDIAVTKNPNSLSVTGVEIYGGDYWGTGMDEYTTAVADGVTPLDTDVESGVAYTLALTDNAFVYDSYLEFDEAQALYWQVSYDKANSPMSFTIQRMPDSQTPAPLKVTVHYAQMDGKCKSYIVYVTPKTNLSGIKLSEEVKHDIVAYNASNKNKNAVTVSLDNMVAALGNDAYIAWKADADLKKTIASGISILTSDGNYTPINDSYTVTFLEANGDETEVASEAKSVRFTFHNDKAIDLTKGYNAYINFKSNKTDKYYRDVVNSVYFPVSFAIPAFEDLLVKDMNVFDAEGKVASAYMLEAYDMNGTTATSTYKFNGAFENLADNVAKGFNFTFELDNDANNKPAASQTSAGLALIADAAYNTTATTSCAVTTTNANYVAITLRNAYAADAYGKALTVKVVNPTYVNVYKYDNTSFKIKVLSPIKEGKFVTNGNAISLTSTGTTVITAEDVWATTVNDAVKYDLFKTAIKQTDGKYNGKGWKRQDIKGVKFSSDGIKFIVETANGIPTDAVVDATTGEIKEASSVSLRAVGNKGDRSKLTIQVTDIWGYTISKEVDVVVE